MSVDVFASVTAALVMQDEGAASAAAPTAVLGGGTEGTAATVADAAGEGLGGAAPAARSADPFGGLFIPLLLGMFLLMIVMTVMQGRKEKKRKAELMSGMGRRDEVRTLGGMIGTIVEIKDDRVRLQIDESTKTRVWISKSAVESILRKGNEKAEAADDVLASDAA